MKKERAGESGGGRGGGKDAVQVQLFLEIICLGFIWFGSGIFGLFGTLT
jgi:hypothetical protein